ncbi:hypothetical protein AAFF_G00299850 [Aldrovandia affinis]|uniref:Uncharacterized protein n=1 Tax=Aldrovandia affinis TaxID=143900 RepID=A0AAD7W0Y2_9TELE|nr:hypothetical protein AAFF_G00299850 [Aldrovandia affinis]
MAGGWGRPTKHCTRHTPPPPALTVHYTLRALQSPLEQPDSQLQERYRQRLHDRVYVLMESMVGSLCDLLEELQCDQLDLHPL